MPITNRTRVAKIVFDPRIHKFNAIVYRYGKWYHFSADNKRAIVDQLNKLGIKHN